MKSEFPETVVVTGAAGFVGAHLLAHLAAAPNAPRRLVALDVCRGAASGVEWMVCDLTDAARVTAVFRDVTPQGIIHLAGVTSGADLRAYFAVNVLAAANLLSVAASLARPPRILVVGSAAQYGVTAGGHEVVAEDRPLLGRTPYAVSKTLQEQWALVYAREKSLPVVCVRPFNLMGPGQPGSIVPGAFLRQIADVMDGRAAEVLVGNTATSRDFVDVRDVVAALWALMTAPDAVAGQVFNIASGEAIRIREMLDACLGLAGCAVSVREDPARLRPNDVPTIVGDATKLRSLTGWQPRVSWRQSLCDMWEYLRRGRTG
jgi:GDP-4-dehydro-6-deoxy-D-mannose reductase